MKNKCDIQVNLTKEERDLILVKLGDRKIEIARHIVDKFNSEDIEMWEEFLKIDNLTKKLMR